MLRVYYIYVLTSFIYHHCGIALTVPHPRRVCTSQHTRRCISVCNTKFLYTKSKYGHNFTKINVKDIKGHFLSILEDRNRSTFLVGNHLFTLQPHNYSKNSAIAFWLRQMSKFKCIQAVCLYG